MGRPRNTVPKYLHHRQTGQARVKVRGKYVYLGAYGSPGSTKEYNRICAELATRSPAQLIGPARKALTVSELLEAFAAHADAHYRNSDGNPTSEIGWLRESVALVNELYGHVPATEFGPVALKAIRQKWVDAGLARTTVNARANRVRRVFKWAASEELVPVAVYTALATVAGLAKGRTTARETEDVKPVLDLHVAAALPHMTPTLRAMVLFGRLTGCRPQDVRQMRAGEIDRTTVPWVYRPAKHKTRYRGGVRTILVGKDAAEVLRPFLDGLRPDQLVFTPARARVERYAALRAKRKSPVQPSQEDRAKPARRKQRRTPAQWTISGYVQAVARACRNAGVPPWAPNQLRHRFGTEVRARFGLEAAQVLLGHTTANTTEIYAERDWELATKVVGRIG